MPLSEDQHVPLCADQCASLCGPMYLSVRTNMCLSVRTNVPLCEDQCASPLYGLTCALCGLTHAFQCSNIYLYVCIEAPYTISAMVSRRLSKLINTCMQYQIYIRECRLIPFQNGSKKKHFKSQRKLTLELLSELNEGFGRFPTPKTLRSCLQAAPKLID